MLALPELSLFSQQDAPFFQTVMECVLCQESPCSRLKKYDVVVANGANAYEAQTDEAKKSDVAYLTGVAYQNKGNNAKATEWLTKVTAGENVAAAKQLKTDIAAAQ